MTSADIRQSFLDFFASKQHAIVPSSSLMPTAPNLLFTNAGMNQFVPYFLGDQAAPWKRVADTQKCIRAGGKHNDLEDVGFDTYHHTMFEMLGNWSFGDYFKKESLTWGWELLTKVWGIPPKRLFATVYSPDKSKGDPSDFDQEAYDIWAGIFKAAGLDPAVHIVNGNKKDNFWMMGDTGPCGPCSEIHFNLLPSDDEAAGRQRVNASDSRCIEIWNHVFIQFNANADGTFAPLAAKHVDTGMGFERVAGIHATTNGFKDFSAEPSNYNADVFKPTLDKLAALSGKTYTKSVPAKRDGLTEQEQIDIAFRVLADHARCVSCAIADGILPGNEGRNYVIRRILRRGIMYGRKSLGLKIGDFTSLIGPVVESLGGVFPELHTQRTMIERAIRAEEESFGATLDTGLSQFDKAVSAMELIKSEAPLAEGQLDDAASFLEKKKVEQFDRLGEEITRMLPSVWILDNALSNTATLRMVGELAGDADQKIFALRRALEGETLGKMVLGDIEHKRSKILAKLEDLTIAIGSLQTAVRKISGRAAFVLYDTYGFPLDMTQLLAAERGLAVDTAGFVTEMEKQRERGRAARRVEIVEAVTASDSADAVVISPTKFSGYGIDSTHATHAKLIDVVKTEKDTYLVFDETPFYAEMGGQVGDSGHALINGAKVDIADCVKDKSGRYLHKVSGALSSELSALGSSATLHVDFGRRRAISRHHTSAHLIHWALRKMLGTHVRQFGTHKTPDRMRFDFTHFEALTAAQIRECEQLINEKVIDNAKVECYEIDYDQKPADVLAFFGDKYGKRVRLVDIGGYSKELCGGTHVATTGEIGVIKIVAEMAIAAGTRRIEAVCGQAAFDHIAAKEAALSVVSARLNAGVQDVAQKFELVLAHQKELEKKLESYLQKEMTEQANKLLQRGPKTLGGVNYYSAILPIGTPDYLRYVGYYALQHAAPGPNVVQVAADVGGKPTFAVFCSGQAIAAGYQAGKIAAQISKDLGGKGGGKPDYAQGGGGDASKLADVLKL